MRSLIIILFFSLNLFPQAQQGLQRHYISADVPLGSVSADWEDRKGNANLRVGNAPTCTTVTINGNNFRAVYFDGAADYMYAANLTTVRTIVMFMAPLENIRYLHIPGNNSTTSFAGGFFWDVGTLSAWIPNSRRNSFAFSLDSLFHTFTVVGWPDSNKAYLDSTFKAKGTGTATGGTAATNFLVGVLGTGALGSLDQYGEFYLVEMLLYDQPLNKAQIDSNFVYFSDNYLNYVPVRTIIYSNNFTGFPEFSTFENDEVIQ